jgi:hypothetical protein
MSGEPNRPYKFTHTAMTMDNRFSGADAAASAVGRNVVQVIPVRPFQSEERPRAGRVIEPVSHGVGRNPHSVGYVYAQRGINNVFSGLVVRTYETR